jgi:hypothetical protein
MQTGLDERVIEHGVVFATRYKAEAGQIREYGPSAILSIEPQQGALMGELIHSEIATNGREALPQFLPVATIAAIAKRTEPLETVSLADDGARAHDFPALASSVARGTDLI